MLIENVVKTLPEAAIYQQDNATCHDSKSTSTFFASNNIQHLALPLLYRGWLGIGASVDGGLDAMSILEIRTYRKARPAIASESSVSRPPHLRDDCLSLPLKWRMKAILAVEYSHVECRWRAVAIQKLSSYRFCPESGS
ncbi:hypothetical protein RF11_02470 [Thelohanellus kitauei]|uniref:Uncharacterized protein n=1 Tax=Thelohanellus kitauei TaxID=669202 RepID=A0A0C2N848_THEKT|nr:hypothetical protein RF11_02470 [Thelohanellus kitauei]